MKNTATKTSTQYDTNFKFIIVIIIFKKNYDRKKECVGDNKTKKQ